MISKPDDLPSDLASAVAASERAELSDNEALIAPLELRIEKLKRELHGQRWAIASDCHKPSAAGPAAVVYGRTYHPVRRIVEFDSRDDALPSIA